MTKLTRDCLTGGGDGDPDDPDDPEDPDDSDDPDDAADSDDPDSHDGTTHKWPEHTHLPPPDTNTLNL